MNITFLIGNGFDINLGLKTRYSDFYNYYKEQDLDHDIILKWMNEDEDKDRWADLETALGEKTEELNENNKDIFLDTFAELETFLLEYLETEQGKYFISDKAVLSEMGRSLRELPDELSLEEQGSYKAICRIPFSEELKYCFISFNYTDILDRILEMAKTNNLDCGSHITKEGRSKRDILGEILHVHGSLTEGAVVGVNDESQINNEVLRKDQSFKNVFIKRRINSQMGQRRTERAEEIINHSQILCIFGMSLGNTDKQWWEYIIQWMLSDNNRRLIIYLRKNPKLFKRHIPTSVIRERDKVKREFWEKGKGDHEQSLYESVSSRIFIIFNSNIFDFPKMEQMEPLLSAVDKSVLSGDYSNLLAALKTQDKA